MPERIQLEAILSDPASTPQEKTAAQAALDSQADPIPLHEQTAWMLQQLGRERIEDLTEDDYERYCIAHLVRSSDPICKEFRYWIPPDEKFLACIAMSKREWWTAILKMALAANRPDAQTHARRKLHEGGE
jgi:hypothetical protein